MSEKNVPTENGKPQALGARTERIPLIVGVCLAVFGVLILGLGMTAVIEWNGGVYGIIVCTVGTAAFAAAFPVYKYLLRRNKSKCDERTEPGVEIPSGGEHDEE